MTLLTCAAGISVGILELINSHKARRPVMEKTLNLVSLDDEELLDVVGGGCGRSYCQPKPCEQPCGGEQQVHGVVLFAGIAFF
jgi:hypothetical protein